MNLKKILSGFVCLAVSLSCFAAPTFAESDIKIYVSEHGDDSKNGSQITSAVKTIERAQALAKRSTAEGFSVDIVFCDDVYCMDSGITIDGERSGTKNARVTYRAMTDKNVSLTLGKKIDKSAFSLSDDIRITPAARGKVYEASLADFDNLSGGVIDILYANGNMQTLSRYPNEGARVNFPMSNTEDDNGNVTDSWVATPDEKMNVWDGNPDMLLYGWIGTYSGSLYKVSSVSGTKIRTVALRNDKVTTATPVVNAYSGGMGVIYNALCEIDVPKEYYIDTERKMLYYYPENGTPSDVYLTTGRSDTVSIKNAQYVNFENLNFFGGNENCFTISSSDNINIYNSRIAGFGGYGVNAANSLNIGVFACEIKDLQGYGVHIDGGEQVTLTSSGNEIRNTKIYDYAKIFESGRPGLDIGGVGVWAHNNEIANSPHNGITFSGNDHIISNNRIRNVMKYSWDSGAIYGGRTWTGRGTVISDNFIYYTTDVIDCINGFRDGPQGGGTDNPGIYLDDLQSGIKVQGNIIYNLSSGILGGGGSDNLIENNSILECRRGMFYDGAGAGQYRVQHIDPTQRYQGRIYREMYNFVNNSNYNESTWNSHYPEWSKLINRYNTFNTNCSFLQYNGTYNENTDSLTTEQKTTLSSSLKTFGTAYDNIVRNNLIAGNLSDLYLANNWGYINMSGLVVSDGQGGYVGVNGNEASNDIIRTTMENAGVTVNGYDITIDGKNFTDGVQRTTDNMGVLETDDYIPSLSSDELDINSGNRFSALVAIYNGAGSLVNVQRFEGIFVYDNQEAELQDIAVPAGAQANWTANIMLWDGYDTLIPLAEKVSLFGGAN